MGQRVQVAVHEPSQQTWTPSLDKRQRRSTRVLPWREHPGEPTGCPRLADQPGWKLAGPDDHATGSPGITPHDRDAGAPARRELAVVAAADCPLLAATIKITTRTRSNRATAMGAKLSSAWPHALGGRQRAPITNRPFQTAALQLAVLEHLAEVIGSQAGKG